MKKILLGMVLAASLVMAIQVSAAPPRYTGSSAYHYYGYPVVRYGWGGGYYWRPGVGVYVGPGYWGAWNPGWRLGYGFPAGFVHPYPAGYPLVSVPLVIEAMPIAPTHVQQEPIVAAPMQPAPPVTYYYCAQPAGYFPYVQSCNQPWTKVNPQSPANPQ